mgnify:CR=1 FL=1
MDKQRVSSRNSESLLEQRYIDKILNQEGKAIWKAQKAAISKYGLKRHSGQLQDKLNYVVEGSTDKYSGDLQISFIKYLRFLDMKKKHQSGKTEKGKLIKRRRQYHIYNRIIFGHYNEIYTQLAYGFTEEVKAQLRADLKLPITV